MILVTGATGTTGRHVVRELSAAGAPVRALVRRVERVAWPDGVEVAQGDLADPESLAGALRGVEKLYLLAPFEPRLVDLERNAIDAALRAGVRHVVKHSGLGAAPDAPMAIGRWHGEAERYLERSGLPFTHVQPQSFMQNLLGSRQAIAAGVLAAPMGDARVSLVDARDVARVGTRALLDPGHEGRRYVVTGPEALPYAEIAAQLEAVIGRPVRYADVSPAEARQGMLAAGVPEWAADAINGLAAYHRAGAGATVTSVVAEVGRQAPRTFAEFLRDHVAVFQGR